MIVDNGKYYMYRHIRLDKNEPFYVGVGTKPEKFNSHIVEYSRAFQYTGYSRGKIWCAITSKSAYNVEILLESDSYTFILEKETEFIKLYGRKCNKSGFLSNLTEGGFGLSGFVLSEDHKRKLSESNKNHPKHKPGYKLPQQTINKMKAAWAGKKVGQWVIDKATEAKKKKIRCLSTGVIYDSVQEAARSIPVTPQHFSTRLKLNKPIKKKMYEYFNVA